MTLVGGGQRAARLPASELRANRRRASAARSPQRRGPWPKRGGHCVTRHPRCTERSSQGSGGPGADAAAELRAICPILPPAGHCARLVSQWLGRGSRGVTRHPRCI